MFILEVLGWAFIFYIVLRLCAYLDESHETRRRADVSTAYRRQREEQDNGGA